MKKKIIIFGIIIFIVLILLGLKFNFFGLRGANENIKTKIALIKEALEKDGYYPSWLVISQKRSSILNALLPNAAKKSQHLLGNALDLWIFDIDGDKKFSPADIEIMRAYNDQIEGEHPELVGAFGTYLKRPFSHRMLHFDTRGTPVRFNY